MPRRSPSRRSRRWRSAACRTSSPHVKSFPSTAAFAQAVVGSGSARNRLATRLQITVGAGDALVFPLDLAAVGAVAWADAELLFERLRLTGRVAHCRPPRVIGGNACALGLHDGTRLQYFASA